MTDEIFNRSSFLAQALRGNNQHVTNNSEVDGIHNFSFKFSGSQSSEDVMDSAFYAPDTSSDQHSPEYINPDSVNPCFRKIEHVGVSGLSLTEASIEENTNNVRKKLIETGDMDRLKDFAERKLSEVGWRLDMLAHCRAIVKKRLAENSTVTFEDLFQELKIPAQNKVPSQIKDDVLQEIKYCFESAVSSKE